MMMPTRKLMIYVHLVIAAVFLPQMLLMPFTGTLYLLGWKGDQTKTEAFRLMEPQVPSEPVEQEAYFRQAFRQQGIEFDFEYVRAGGGSYIFRPATRVHYVAEIVGKELVFFKIDPTILKRLIELHKGHGPTLFRWYQAIFGVALILVTLSGLWLSWTVPPYRKATLVSFGIGALIIGLCLF